jgi:hypothetical protein
MMDQVFRFQDLGALCDSLEPPTTESRKKA